MQSSQPNIKANHSKCVVTENIHTPTTEGIGNSEGVGGSKTQEIPEGRGVGRSIWFPDALLKYRSSCLNCIVFEINFSFFKKHFGS